MGEFNVLRCVLCVVILSWGHFHNALATDMDMRAVHSYRSDSTVSYAFAHTNFVYLGITGGTQIIDVSNPVVPKVVGKLTIGPISQQAIAGNYAYGGSWGSDGIFVYDISLPAQPVFVKKVVLPDQASAANVIVSDGRAYVSSSNGKFFIYDVSDALNPVFLGVFNTEIFDFAISGSFAYVASGASGLQIVDVSDAAAPKLIGSLKTRSAANFVVASGKYAYVSEIDGVNVIDVSDPANPVLKTKLTDSEFRGVVQMTASDSAIYVVTPEAISKLSGDASQPAVRLNAWSSNEPSPGLRSLALSEGRLFAISQSGFTEIGAVVANPQRSGQFSNIGSAFYTTAVGDLALIADGTNLNIVDVSNIANPHTVAEYSHSRGIGQMKIVGDTVFFNDFRNVGVLDVSDRANPALVGQFDAVSTNNYYSIDVFNDYAYVASASEGIKIYNVADPRNPYFVTSWNLTPKSFTSYVLASGNRAFVGASSRGLVVLDVSDPTNPKQTASITNIPISVMAKSGSLLVAGSVKGNLEFVDIGNSDEPIHLTSIMAETGVTDLTIVSNLLYVAEFASGIEVYDISNPANPQLVGGNAMFSAYGLTAAKGKILAASSDLGGVILNAFTPTSLSMRIDSFGALNIRLQGPQTISAQIDKSADLVQWQLWTNVVLSDVPLELPVASGAAGFYRAQLVQ